MNRNQEKEKKYLIEIEDIRKKIYLKRIKKLSHLSYVPQWYFESRKNHCRWQRPDNKKVLEDFLFGYWARGIKTYYLEINNACSERVAFFILQRKDTIKLTYMTPWKKNEKYIINLQSILSVLPKLDIFLNRRLFCTFPIPRSEIDLRYWRFLSSSRLVKINLNHLHTPNSRKLVYVNSLNKDDFFSVYKEVYERHQLFTKKTSQILDSLIERQLRNESPRNWLIFYKGRKALGITKSQKFDNESVITDFAGLRLNTGELANLYQMTAKFYGVSNILGRMNDRLFQHTKSIFSKRSITSHHSHCDVELRNE